jgi:uncharacterized GH25 family protein
MRRSMLAMVVLGAALTTARAHFIWIIPEADNKAKVVFSDSLAPDGNVDIKKISGTKYYVRNAAGKVNATAATLGKDAYLINLLSDDVRIVAAVCDYGALQRGDSKPFHLIYTAKLLLQPIDAKPLDELPLEIVPVSSDARRLVVLYKNKPVPDAEVVILPPDAEKETTLKTDAQGEFTIADLKPGTYGFRARHVAAARGELDRKNYEEVRTYATLVMKLGTSNTTAAPGEAKSDPEATRWLAEARAARAEWAHFPGFKADVEVNLSGQVSHGKVQVDAKGKLTLSDLDPTAEKWAKPILSSVVSHRLAGAAEMDTPCCFVSRDVDHPLGREVRVLTDEMHSSYRIKDRQIMVVNRAMKESRFSITMQENIKNAEGKFLPANYVVHYWDAHSGQLQRTEAHTQTWTRVDIFDLPVFARVITADKELTVRSLTLSNHKLLPGTAAK